MRDLEKADPERARDDGLDELRDHEQIAARDEEAVAARANRFFHIAEAVRAAAQDKRDAHLLTQNADFSREERLAIELIYAAFTAEDLESGDWLDAERREAMLNQGLRVLQPVLALGLVPELGEGQEIYLELAERVEGLRARLESLADAQEEVQHHELETAAVDEDDSDEDDDDEDDDAALDVTRPAGDAPADEEEVYLARARASARHLGLDEEPDPPKGEA